MNNKAFRYLAITLLFGGLALWLADHSDLFQVEYNSVVVSLERDAYQQIKNKVRAVYSNDLGKVVWLALTQANYEKLQDSGVPYELHDPPMIRVNGYRFDPRVAEPEPPEELIADYPAGVYNFYILQFYTPTRDEWIDKLQVEGVETLRYWNGYAYLIQVTPQQAAKIENYDFVRWVGPYHPAYRVSPELLQAEESQGTIEVWVYDAGREEEGAGQTIQAVGALGGKLIDEYRISASQPLVAAIFDMRYSTLVEVAHLPNVMLVFSWSPPFIEGE